MPNDDEVVIPAEDGGVIIDLEKGEAIAADAAALAAAEATPPDTVVVVAPEPAEVVPPVQPQRDEALEELRSQLKASADREAAANRERLRSEQVAQQREADLRALRDENKRSQEEAVENRRSVIESGIAAAKAEADAASRRRQAFMEAGDFANEGKENLVISEAISRAVLLENRKQELETSPQAIVRPEGRIEAPPQNSDPVEQYIQTKTPRTQEWLRQHTDAVTDTKKNNKTVGAHYEALGEGLVPDTDAYFEFLDKKLGYRVDAAPARTEAARVTEAVPPKPPKKVPPPAAPVSRESPRDQQLGNGRIYLTRSELEAAEALNLSPAEYGKRKAAMQKQGFYH